MPKQHRLLGVLFAVSLVFAACGDDGEDTAQDLQQQAEDVAGDAAAMAQDAWASLRTDGDRLIDEIQTRNDPEAKDRLLDRCRDTVEQLRRAQSNQAERADELCDRIRDTDVNNRDAWSDIKDRIREIDPGS